ncbi:MAG: ATP-dependent Clp protease ATP-binding subunit [Immundisolibacterales bacterium]|nr:ATP-dependent Clp protease ATP-binding subunit [Immundisolibacterales bacterium]
MNLLTIRELCERQDACGQRVLRQAAEAAARGEMATVGVEIVLLTLLRDRSASADLRAVLARAGVDADPMEHGLAHALQSRPRGRTGALPAFGGALETLLRSATTLALDEYREPAVAPVRWIEAILRRRDQWAGLLASLPGLEALGPAALAAPPAVRGEEGKPPRHRESGDCTEDLVARARRGEIDSAVGFESEMEAIAAILLRRRQCSAVVVGEPGVGKTACALAFVRALANREDRIPAALRDSPVRELVPARLRAAGAWQGAAEERLEVALADARRTDAILFVDDLHVLAGASNGAGGELLETLVRDGTRLLATCGWREWRRSIEPDPALARRLAAVRIEEPGPDRAVAIVHAASPRLAGHHAVAISEEAVLDRCVRLSHRYIVGRRLPDKAIAVLDSACARARMRDEEGANVNEDDVRAVVSDLAGVPSHRLLCDTAGTGLGLETDLAKRVVGQPEALRRCADQARAWIAGLSDRRHPVGALLFTGPSGVGKTETAHALADTLFAGRILTVNLSEYQEAHTVSGLKGAPAGYVGYGEGGVLTEGIRKTPCCVVLLDEIEKAHRDVIEMLYQVLDRGWMEDAEGIEADFSNAVVILTSNVGDRLMEEIGARSGPESEARIEREMLAELHRVFPPAFIGRLQVVPYRPLSEETLERIAVLRLRRLAELYTASHHAPLGFHESVREWLCARVQSSRQGARVLDALIARSVRPALAEHILGRIAEGGSPGALEVRRSPDGRIEVVSRPEA